MQSVPKIANVQKFRRGKKKIQRVPNGLKKDNYTRDTYISDGNLEIDAHVWSYLGYFKCLRHLMERSHTSIFLSRRPIFLQRAKHVLSYHLLQVP